VPETVSPIEAAVATLSASLSDLQLAGLRDASDDEVWMFHFCVGVRLREAFGLCHEGSPLSQEFRSNGMLRPDEMSHALLLALRRQLNG